MKKIGLNVFEYEELSKEAQDRVYNDYQNCFIYPFDDDITNTLDKFCEIFNVRLVELNYDHCYSKFYVTYDSYDQECGFEDMTTLRLRTFIINNFFDDIYKGKYYSKSKWIKDDNNEPKFEYVSRHSKVVFEKGCALTGVCFDMDILQPMWDFIENPKEYRNCTYEGLIERCLDRLMEAFNDDYSSLLSREYFETEVVGNLDDNMYFEDGTVAMFSVNDIIA